ncbi:hypothetical protein [Limibacterium fermenti]|uniref:hypothetical protein n=1 Tax=Limibacterium fermenti TaxID=3229863 RepID=UPI002697EE24
MEVFNAQQLNSVKGGSSGTEKEDEDNSIIVIIDGVPYIVTPHGLKPVAVLK